MYKEQFQKKLEQLYLSVGFDSGVAAGMAVDLCNHLSEFRFSEEQFRQLCDGKLSVSGDLPSQKVGE